MSRGHPGFSTGGICGRSGRNGQANLSLTSFRRRCGPSKTHARGHLINTINCKTSDQKDIRSLQALAWTLRAVLKGRANYLCPVDSRPCANGPGNVDEMRVLSRSWSGSSQAYRRPRRDQSQRPAERDIWLRLSAETRVQGRTARPAIEGACPFYRARQVAQSATSWW